MAHQGKAVLAHPEFRLGLCLLDGQLGTLSVHLRRELSWGRLELLQQPTAMGRTTFLHQISTPSGAIGAGSDGAMDVALLPWGQDLLGGLVAVAARMPFLLPPASCCCSI